MLKNFKLFRKHKEGTLTLEKDLNAYSELIVGNPKTATLEIKMGIKDNCSMHNPFGLCTIDDCLQCESSAYKIVFDNGICLETIDFDDVQQDGEKYFLEFQDKIDKDIFEYLVNGNSDYRITRLKDNVVLRRTKEDYFSKYGHNPKVRTFNINEENRKRLVLK